MTAHTWPAGTRPTAEQLDEWLTVCSPTERRDTLDRLLTHDEAGLRCWERQHEHRAETAERQVRELVEQRDAARSIAAQLEAELAERPVALELVAGRSYLLELRCEVFDDRLEWLRELQERFGVHFVVVDGTARELDEDAAELLLADLERRLAEVRS